jgi:uncharacterized protein involved in exopolysaccharide biosynthesis
MIRYRDADPGTASAMVSAIVSSFEKETAQMKKEAARQVDSLYQEQVRLARQELAAMERSLAPAPAGPPASVPIELETRRDFLTALEARRIDAYNSALAATLEASGSVQIVDLPDGQAKRVHNWAQLAIVLFSALLLTSAANLGVIAILTLSDRSIRSAADVARLTTIPSIEMTRLDIPNRENGVTPTHPKTNARGAKRA